MFSLTLPGKSLFSPPSIPAPAPPPPPVQRDDPAVAAAAEKRRLSEKQRKGRSAAILTGGQGVTEDANLSRPEARGGAQLLGETG